ncbi:PAS domain-containing protein [Terricaulis sp.]|uniref:PAS domain-containing protein n=1 Tax=Terricaulis sp. TaxID=2768686 RepID=UPI00378372DA
MTSSWHATDEIQFGFEELFFSRTDPAGIIRSGNSVFQRVSIYNWEELIGRPHKLVRHPDTPRAVFWLLWRNLKAGEPIGAYVKNRAKDGRFYWVFALASPIEDGYLSVRLRPSSPILDTIKQEYATLADLERREQLAPERSAELLLERLSQLGFADYPSFMATALGAEIAERDRKLGWAADSALASLRHLQDLAAKLIVRTDSIAQAYQKNENVPLNFRILAAQLGESGNAIGVIATNYSLLSAEMREILDGFIVKAKDVQRTIENGYFLTGTARLQREVAQFVAKETDGDPEMRRVEAATLQLQQDTYRTRAVEGMREIDQCARAFQATCLQMRRLAAGLEVTRVMSMVECAREAEIAQRTAELLADLQAFQREVAEGLKEIEAANAAIVGGVRGVLKQTEPAAVAV